MSELSFSSLMVTSGNGPAECHQAVGHVIQRMEAEAVASGLSLALYPVEAKHGPKSAVVQVYGDDRQAFTKAWTGTILWRMESQLRRHHKRGNWFVGVFEFGEEAIADAIHEIFVSDIQFVPLRAGGPGGQHQNKTNSAIRASHIKSGLSVVVREERSQHRNKALAVKRLRNLAQGQAQVEAAQRRSLENLMHGKLDRGNPVRRFSGVRFTEEF